MRASPVPTFQMIMALSQPACTKQISHKVRKAHTACQRKPKAPQGHRHGEESAGDKSPCLLGWSDKMSVNEHYHISPVSPSVSPTRSSAQQKSRFGGQLNWWSQALCLPCLHNANRTRVSRTVPTGPITMLSSASCLPTLFLRSSEGSGTVNSG